MDSLEDDTQTNNESTAFSQDPPAGFPQLDRIAIYKNQIILVHGPRKLVMEVNDDVAITGIFQLRYNGTGEVRSIVINPLQEYATNVFDKVKDHIKELRQDLAVLNPTGSLSLTKN